MISILWVAFGYSLAFVGDGPWIGTLDRWFLSGMTMDGVNPAAKTIPEALFMLYQMTFAIITVALVAGAVADRMRFSAYLMFSVGWFMFVYVPLAHWVWGGGFLATMGVLDFAGGLVVHLSAGVGGLVAAHVDGPSSRLWQRKPRRHSTCRSPLSAPVCCGSAGSASMADQRWLQIHAR